MTNATGQCEMANALASCASGNQDGLSRIVEAEGGRLMGIAQRMLQRRDLAEEAVQDALVQIWHKAGQFRAGEGSARGWIFAILRNRCLNILRDGKRLSTLDDASLLAMQDARHAAAVDGLDKVDSVALRDCLGGLDDAARRSILLAYVAGYSHGEIAALQKVPLGTCKSWIKRGLDALRRCLS